MQTDKNHQNSETKVAPRRRSRWLWWVLILLLVFILLSPFLMHFGPVQNWVKDRVISQVSKKTLSEVSIEGVDFSIYKGFLLNDFFISSPDNAQDTLMHIGEFSTSLTENILSLWNGKIYLDEISLIDASIYINKVEGDSITNMTRFLSRLSTDNRSKSRAKPLYDIDLQKINFKSVVISIEDIAKENNTYVSLRRGIVDFDHIDMENDSVSIDQLTLHQPYINIEKGKSNRDIISANSPSSDDFPSDNRSVIIPLTFLIKDIAITEGQFILEDNNHARRRDSNSLDYHHLDVSDFNLKADNVHAGSPFELSATIEELGLVEQSGFRINGLKVEEFEIDTSHLLLSDFNLSLKNSTVANYLELEYDQLSDFRDFGDKVRVISDMRGSVIAVSDLLYFFPELQDKPFFQKNRNSTLRVSGIVNGNMEQLEADNLSLAIDTSIYLKGSISASNLNSPKNALFNMYIDEMETSLSALQDVIPRFSPPEQFFKLDPIVFTGDIEGFFNDLVVYGSLTSNLGQVELDMRLDTKDGINDARYSGEISLIDFDLQKWTDNPDFGYTTLSGKVIDGQGLILENLNTDLAAGMQSFDYRGYRYSNVDLQGRINKNQFVGSFSANDPNLSLDFDGEILIEDAFFNSDFKADIKKINLSELNLSKEITDITGNFDLQLQGSSINDFTGTAKVKDLQMVYKDKSFDFDSLYLSSSPSKDDNRFVVLYSDLMNVSLDGKFDLVKVVPTFKNLIYNEHPAWADKLGIDSLTQNLDNEQKFRFKINVKDTRDYLELANVKDLRLAYVSIEGSALLAENQYETVVNIDTSFYKDYTIQNIRLKSDNRDQVANFNLDIAKILSGDRYFEPIQFRSSIEEGIIDFNVKTSNVIDSVGNVDIGLSVTPRPHDIKIHVREQGLNMFSADWTVSDDNEIIIGDKYLSIDNFYMTDGDRTIRINDKVNKGIQAEIENFDFQLIDGIIAYDKIAFAGIGSVLLSVDSIYTTPVINGIMDIPEFTLNDVDYGHLQVEAKDNNDGSVNASVYLLRDMDNMQVDVSAEYNKDTKYLNGTVDVDDLVLDIFEFIIDDGISRTTGTTDIDAIISGPIDDLTLFGEGFLKNAATEVDYLGSYLNLGSEPIILTDKSVDFTGVTVQDKYNNEAIIEGGFVHDMFADFALDMSMSSNNFLVLDTEKGDNAMYYGQGMGQMDVSFAGPVHSTDIVVNAITGEGTTLNIPIEDSYEDFDESFIKFVDRKAIAKDTSLQLDDQVTLEGLDLEMNLTITESSNVNIIFDEKTNDVIRGNGIGDLRIVVTREGEFNVFGEYEVFAGEYLFTAWGIVAKPFKVRRGGNITWTGDPVNANLNIEADYEDLRVPTNIFLQEYLVTGNADLAAQSRKRTRVDLTLDLGGTLYKPVVNFDIKFPELQGELRTFADAKLRTIKENEADLNEQVAGLIIFRSFLPSNRFGTSVATGNAAIQTGYNTLSEFVSNQLSYLLSSILQEALTDNGFISGIDFEIGISRNAGLLEDVADNNYFPDEIEVHFKPRFQNDKWGLDYGTSFVNAQSSVFGLTNYVIHDVALEYFLTEDRRLKLRAYGKWDKDEVQFQNEQKYGLGISYRKEFGSLIDFKNEMQQQVSKIAIEEDEGQ